MELSSKVHGSLASSQILPLSPAASEPPYLTICSLLSLQLRALVVLRYCTSSIKAASPSCSQGGHHPDSLSIPAIRALALHNWACQYFILTSDRFPVSSDHCPRFLLSFLHPRIHPTATNAYRQIPLLVIWTSRRQLSSQPLQPLL